MGEVVAAVASSMPSWVVIFVFVAVGAGVGILASSWGRRAARGRLDEPTSGVVSTIFSNVAVLHAVILAFLVLTVWEQHSAADEDVSEEAARLEAVYHDAAGLPSADAKKLRGYVRDYTNAVIDKEWRVLGQGKIAHEAEEALEHSFGVLRTVEPKSVREQAFHQEILGKLNEVTERRALRIHASRAEMPGPFWLLLAAGMLVTVGLAALMPVSSQRLHALLNASLAGTGALVIALIFVLDSPFAGDLGVGSEAFREAIEEFAEIDKAEKATH
jgi:hypothetical protein